MALANDGRVFVSDGYCNSRVVEYAADGTFRGAFLLPAEGAAMRVPHSVVLQACPRKIWLTRLTCPPSCVQASVSWQFDSLGLGTSPSATYTTS